MIRAKVFQVRERMKNCPGSREDMLYAQIVKLGEILSSNIVDCYFKSRGFGNLVEIIPAKEMIFTDTNFRNGKIKQDITTKRIRLKVIEGFFKNKILLTQGFIAGTTWNDSFVYSTLGREGSDLTMITIGIAFDLPEVILYKDVLGLFLKDPKIFTEEKPILEITRKHALELLRDTGAQVIHQRAIETLEEQQSEMVLLIKSFLHPELPGTRIIP